MEYEPMWMIVSATLLVALGVVVFLWLKTHKSERSAAASARAAKEDLDSKAQETQALSKKVESLKALTYINVFSSQSVYKLLGKGEVDFQGAKRTHGVVQVETGVLTPFLTSDSLAHLEPEDCFSPIRGQLAKLGPEAFKVSAAPVVPEAPATPTARDVEATQAGTEVRSAQEAQQLAAAAASAGLDLELDAGQEFPDSDRTVVFSAAKHKPIIPQNPNAGLTYLKVVSGPDTDTVFHLPFGEATVGREKSNEVALGDSGSSRAHCKVIFTKHRFLLRDNNSTNGTLCNGQKVDEQWLEFGDRIQVADTEMVFSCEGYDLQQDKPDAAIKAFEKSLERAPDFLTALKVLAFLLERNVARQREAAALWSKITELERSS